MNLVLLYGSEALHRKQYIDEYVSKKAGSSTEFIYVSEWTDEVSVAASSCSLLYDHKCIILTQSELVSNDSLLKFLSKDIDCTVLVNVETVDKRSKLWGLLKKYSLEFPKIDKEQLVSFCLEYVKKHDFSFGNGALDCFIERVAYLDNANINLCTVSIYLDMFSFLGNVKTKPLNIEPTYTKTYMNL